MHSRFIKYLSAYLALAIMIASVLGSINFMTYYRLSKYGIETRAVVTKTSCSNHMTFSYQFSFKGQNVDGSGGDNYGNPSCDTLKEGDLVLIYYLPLQPEINVPGDPKERLENELFSISAAALIFPALVIFFVYFNKWTKKTRRAAKNNQG